MSHPLQRLFSTLAPKRSSKKTKSSHQQFPGLPRIQYDKKKKYLLPAFNHVLEQNKEISKRERHFRRLLASAQCATTPLNPCLTEFVPPYWLSGSYGLNPRLQTVAHPRIIKAIAFKNDPAKLNSALNSRVLTKDDLEQGIKVLESSVEELPKLDKILIEADKKIPSSQHTVEFGSGKEMYKYRKNYIIKEFSTHLDDSGTIYVQAAVLSLRIRTILQHLYKNPQDTSSRVLADTLIQRRRKKLEWLRRTKFEDYCSLIRDLGLKVA